MTNPCLMEGPGRKLWYIIIIIKCKHTGLSVVETVADSFTWCSWFAKFLICEALAKIAKFYFTKKKVLFNMAI